MAANAAEMLRAMQAGSANRTSSAAASSGAPAAALGSQQAMSIIIKLLLLHDRSIQALEDRSSITVLVWCPELKKQLVDARSVWQKGNPKKGPSTTRGADEEELPAARAPSVPHPMGCSQKSLLHSVLLAGLQKVWERSTTERAERMRSAISSLMALSAAQVDSSCFRLSPRFREPHDAKPWAWTILFAEAPEAQYVQHWYSMAAFVPAEEGSTAVACAVRPARSIDGGLARQLRAVLDNAGAQAGLRWDEGDTGGDERPRKQGSRRQR
jgi:hypothetical protein